MKTLATAILGLALIGGIPAIASADQTMGVETLRAAAPEYPVLAQRKGVTGHVVLEYTVNKQGRAENIQVVDARPKRVFDEAAIEALQKSQFVCPEVDGEKIAVDGVRKRYVFDLASN